ncbi:MAG: porin family protein [Candidatus Zixiibacteriota bacterium]
MKKAVLVLGMVILFSVSAAAIEVTGFGVKAGFNSSKFTGDDFTITEPGGTSLYKTWKYSGGYSAGGFATFAINDRFSFQPELLFTVKNNAVDYTNCEVNLTYVEIPMLFKFNFQPEGNIQPQLYVGPYFALKNKAKVVVDSTSQAYILGEEVTGQIEVDIKNVKRSDFGIVFGTEFDFNSTIGTVIFEARYSIGLVSILKDPAYGWNILNDDYEGADLKNNSFTFLIGYSF